MTSIYSTGMRYLDPIRRANTKRMVELLQKDAAGTISVFEDMERRELSEKMDEDDALARRMEERDRQMHADLCYERQCELRAHPQAISAHDA